MEAIDHLFSAVLWSVEELLRYPLNPSQRLYLPYIAASALVAAAVYAGSARDQDGGLLAFLFPRRIWRHRSTRVDLLYLIPHQLVRLWIYGPLMLFLALASSRLTAASWTLAIGDEPPFAVDGTLAVTAAYTVILVAYLDFWSFLCHWLQHRIPLLWEFHRVHHSAEVLNPFSNYREHPVDNLLYALSNGVNAGFLAGSAHALFGLDTVGLTILGVYAPRFFFNLLGYHLRHSHIWVRWPGPLAWLFGSPAHHQVHHSCKPGHINKNMAFLFPLWDVLFRSYHLPRRPDEMEMGLGDGSEAEYAGFFQIYVLPFKRLIAARKRPREELDARS